MKKEECEFVNSTCLGDECILEHSICWDRFDDNCEVLQKFYEYQEQVYIKD